MFALVPYILTAQATVVNLPVFCWQDNIKGYVLVIELSWENTIVASCGLRHLTSTFLTGMGLTGASQVGDYNKPLHLLWYGFYDWIPFTTPATLKKYSKAGHRRPLLYSPMEVLWQAHNPCQGCYWELFINFFVSERKEMGASIIETAYVRSRSMLSLGLQEIAVKFPLLHHTVLKKKKGHIG